MEWLLVASALLLAFVNGANDNLKGMATLIGSGTLRYRQALGLATASTALGSLSSILLATALLKVFSAKGLVPPEFLNVAFLAGVATAAALTVLAATARGFARLHDARLARWDRRRGVCDRRVVRLTSARWRRVSHCRLLVSPFLAIALTLSIATWRRLADAAYAGIGGQSCVWPRTRRSGSRGQRRTSRSSRLRCRIGPSCSSRGREECRVHGAVGVQVDHAVSFAHVASGKSRRIRAQD